MVEGISRKLTWRGGRAGDGWSWSSAEATASLLPWSRASLVAGGRRVNDPLSPRCTSSAPRRGHRPSSRRPGSSDRRPPPRPPTRDLLRKRNFLRAVGHLQVRSCRGHPLSPPRYTAYTAFAWATRRRKPAPAWGSLTRPETPEPTRCFRKPVYGVHRFCLGDTAKEGRHPPGVRLVSLEPTRLNPLVRPPGQPRRSSAEPSGQPRRSSATPNARSSDWRPLSRGSQVVV
jgi:hypothetical protein